MAMSFLTPIKMIQSLEQLQAQGFSVQKPQETTTPRVSFADLLRKTVEDVNTTNKQTDVDIISLVTGMASDNLHNIEIEAVKADLALRTMVSVRNKVLDAYTEIMRITL
jgi:flagellar hook-basal body complex protein FliE